MHSNVYCIHVEFILMYMGNEEGNGNLNG